MRQIEYKRMSNTSTKDTTTRIYISHKWMDMVKIHKMRLQNQTGTKRDVLGLPSLLQKVR